MSGIARAAPRHVSALLVPTDKHVQRRRKKPTRSGVVPPSYCNAKAQNAYGIPSYYIGRGARGAHQPLTVPRPRDGAHRHPRGSIPVPVPVALGLISSPRPRGAHRALIIHVASTRAQSSYPWRLSFADSMRSASAPAVAASLSSALYSSSATSLRTCQIRKVGLPCAVRLPTRSVVAAWRGSALPGRYARGRLARPVCVCVSVE